MSNRTLDHLAAFASRRARIGASALSLALFGALGTTFDGVCLPSSARTLYAQNIINKTSDSSNSFQSFSTGHTEKATDLGSKDAVGTLDGAQTVAMEFPAPNSPAKQIDALSYRIPFVFPKGSDVNSAVAIELYCSADSGETWASYATVRSDEGKNAFLFDAPQPGEYWFVLKTKFKNGKVAYSSTRAYEFVDPNANAFTGFDDEPLAENSEEPTTEEQIDAPQLPSFDETLFVDETSAQNAEKTNDKSNSFALNDDSEENAKETNAETKSANQGSGKEVKVTPRPGRLKSLSFGKEDKTDKLMVFVRWFTPEELEEKYRGDYVGLDVEYSLSANGPWKTVGKNLSIKENGYGWIAEADNMKPFYVRTVVTDSKGQTYDDVTVSPLDVTTPGVKDALGYVNTPVPFPADARKKTTAKNSEDKEKNTKSTNAKNDGETGSKPKGSRVRRTSSKEEVVAKSDEEKAEEVEESREEMAKIAAKKNVKNLKPPKSRPIVPAPTNPNQIEVNPLFTRGVGVLFRSAQTRYAPDNSGAKRSIFTPPSQAARTAMVPPANQRKSAEQIAASRARAAREKMEKDAKYARDHEMEMLEQKPELMQGRIFYLDSNGNMTTTPPPEFLQASNDWQVTNVGDPVAVGQDPNGFVTNNGFVNNGEPPVYMPQNTDDYDASVRSGVANMTNDSAFLRNAASGTSPINSQYNTPNQQTPGAGNYQTIPQTSYPTVPQNQAVPQTSYPTTPQTTYQTIPKTSYSQSYTPGTIPYNYNNGANANAGVQLPPRPTVAK